MKWMLAVLSQLLNSTNVFAVVILGVLVVVVAVVVFAVVDRSKCKSGVRNNYNSTS